MPIATAAVGMQDAKMLGTYNQEMLELATSYSVNVQYQRALERLLKVNSGDISETDHPATAGQIVSDIAKFSVDMIHLAGVHIGLKEIERLLAQALECQARSRRILGRDLRPETSHKIESLKQRLRLPC